jgi:hypothetical protein
MGAWGREHFIKPIVGIFLEYRFSQKFPADAFYLIFAQTSFQEIYIADSDLFYSCNAEVAYILL